VSEKFSDKDVTDFEYLPIESYGAQVGLFVPCGDGSNNLLHGRSPSEDGA
jgi:hypothetical protein